jgi:hypothetical protein
MRMVPVGSFSLALQQGANLVCPDVVKLTPNRMIEGAVGCVCLRKNNARTPKHGLAAGGRKAQVRGWVNGAAGAAPADSGAGRPRA